MKTKYIVADFSNGKEIYDEIEQQLRGIPVGILGMLLNGIIFSLYLSSLNQNKTGTKKLNHTHTHTHSVVFLNIMLLNQTPSTSLLLFL